MINNSYSDKKFNFLSVKTIISQFKTHRLHRDEVDFTNEEDR